MSHGPTLGPRSGTGMGITPLSPGQLRHSPVTHALPAAAPHLCRRMLPLVSQSRIKEILDGLYFDTRTQRGKGTAFERLVRQFLLTDPRYAERFDEVWMWNDWP